MATKWGIVGAGKISHDFVTALRSLPEADHQVVSIAAKDLERAKDFAERHLISVSYGSYEELAKDMNVDIVYVGILNKDHLRVGKLMLESGKHVLMEKPMCMNLKQTKELTDFARTKNLFLMEAVWSRFFPVFKILEAELTKKTIGDIVHVDSTFGFCGVDIPNMQKKELGGSAILNIGIYLVSTMSVIFKKKPLKMVAVGNLNDDGVDQNVAVSFLYEGGSTGNGALSSVAELQNDMTIIGTKGQIKIDSPYLSPTTITTPEKKYVLPLPETIAPCNYPRSSGLRYEAMRVRECLQKGLVECPEMTLKDSEQLAELMDELRKQVGMVIPEDT